MSIVLVHFISHRCCTTSGHAAKVFKQRFPALAQRVEDCAEALSALGYSDDIARPQFGYWYNYCINGARGPVKGVMTRPHVDAKNLAFMMCAVFVYGTWLWRMS